MPALKLLFRLFVVAVCGFSAVDSIRWARADWFVARGTVSDLRHGMSIEPENGDLLARAMASQNRGADTSWVTDEELRRAAAKSPMNSDLWMALGLREEFLGNESQAEADLIRAADLDHQFMPAWTLASYYYRTEKPEKVWPWLQRCLSLDPLGYDPTPVFDLAWDLGSDGAKIKSLLPRRGPINGMYLAWLVDRDRLDAALEAWPQALAAADPEIQTDTDALVRFIDSLIRKGRAADAVKPWNQLVGRRLITAGALDPDAGLFIADPDFSFPLLDSAFGWHVAHAAGVSEATYASSLSVELDGNEPEALSLLSAVLPTAPAKTYRLEWKFDSSQLSNPLDPGFAFRAVAPPEREIATCPFVQPQGDSGMCTFSVPADAPQIRLELMYRRALGTVKPSGVLRVLSVALHAANQGIPQ